VISNSDETASLLSELPGGRELLQWFAGEPDFGDAEIVSLHLDRKGPSTLRIEIGRGARYAVITFLLGHWIDVSLRGFSDQNVIGGLALKRAGERELAPWEMGVGVLPGDTEIELAPCFGASGTIRARVLGVNLEPTR
jgi:hypothetical protein